MSTHPEHGAIYERQFVWNKGDSSLEKALHGLSELGILMDFQLQGDRLLIKRRHIEGSDIREILKDTDAPERWAWSRDVFRGVHERLRELEGCGGHGGVHPGNVLDGLQGFELLDALANRVVLEEKGASSKPPARVWLWGVRKPAPWSLSDWDCLHLLRMSTLFWKGPDTWASEAFSELEIINFCKQWAQKMILTLQPEDDLFQTLGKASSLVERWVTESVSSKPQPLPLRPAPKSVTLPPSKRPIETLQELLHGHLQGRMLPIEAEEQIQSAALERGLSEDEIDDGLSFILTKVHAKRERELDEQAASYLLAGTSKNSRLVRESAIQSALHTYRNYGIADDDAQSKLRTLNSRLGLERELDGQRSWRPRVDEYLHLRCKKGSYRQKDLEAMVRLVCSFRVPEHDAERVVTQYLDDKGYKRKRGIF